MATGHSPRAGYRFDRFTLSVTRGTLVGSDGIERPLSPMSLALLQRLVDNPGRPVSRHTLMAAISPDAHVSDDVVTQCVKELRQALRGSARRLLRTHPSLGYYLAAEVTASAHAVEEPTQQSPIGDLEDFVALEAGEPFTGRKQRAATSVRVGRRLRAIVAADVVGYARHMEQDETGTLKRLARLHHGLINALATPRGGRLVTVVGDGFMLEFQSAVGAITFAVELQTRLAEEATEGTRSLQMRVGVNVGDVIVYGGRVTGDAVNVAARLETAAQPGGILASAAVLYLARNHAPAGFAAVGPLRLKNISRPIEAWQWQPAKSAGQLSRGEPQIERYVGGDSVGADSLPIVQPTDWPPPVVAMPAVRSPPRADDGARPSVVVLPFANLCDDEKLADGITEGLITTLARALPHGSSVIGRGVSFALKGKVGDPRTLGRELGIGHALDGRVDCRGERVRITAELVDTETGVIAWTQSLDHTLAKPELAIDEIVGQVGNTLRRELTIIAGRRAERKSPNDVTADDLLMRGWATLCQPRSETQLQRACAFFSAAADATSCAGDASVGLAIVHSYLALGMDICYSHHAEEAERALSLARSSISTDSILYLADGLLLRALGQPHEACRSFEQAITLDPNRASARVQLGFAERCAGRPERLFPTLDEAMRLSPADPETPLWFNYAALSAFDLGRVDEGVEWARKALRANPALSFIHFDTAAALALAGRLDDARLWLATGLTTGFVRTIEDYARRFGYLQKGVSGPRYQQLLEGLRLAGLSPQ